MPLSLKAGKTYISRNGKLQTTGTPADEKIGTQRIAVYPDTDSALKWEGSGKAIPPNFENDLVVELTPELRAAITGAAPAPAPAPAAAIPDNFTLHMNWKDKTFTAS